MNRSIFLPRLLTSFFMIAMFAATGLAQSDTRPTPDRDLDITLQVLTATTCPVATNDIPANLLPIAKHLKAELRIANLRLAGTYVGRTSTSGGFEYKSISESLLPVADGEPPTFFEWSLNGIRMGSGGIYAQSFRFGSRIAVKTTGLVAESGKSVPIFNYEWIGLNTGRIGIPEDQPIVLGSLSLPKNNSTLFLILTVRAAR